MKSELQEFNQNKIAQIQEKCKMKKENISNFMEKMRKQAQIYQKALFYKNALDNGKIEEKEIPSEYVKIIKNIYEEEIARIQRIINQKSQT